MSTKKSYTPKIKTYSPKQFARLKPETQKRLIIEDALAQIKAKKYIASPGTYTDFLGVNFGKIKKKLEYIDPEFSNEINIDGVDIRDVVQNAKECKVCAIGGLFASLAHVADGCPLQHYVDSLPEVNHKVNDMYTPDPTKTSRVYDIDRDSMFGKLEEYFGCNIYVMEAAFEGEVVSWSYFQEYAESKGVTREMLMKDCSDFYYKYEDNATARLEAILRNTLRNNFEFIPARRVIDA